MSTATRRAARWRGGFVCACSAALSAVAHGHAGGEPPRGGALMMLMVVCATVGAAASSASPVSRRGRVAFMAAALAGGQLAGHLALGMTADHCGQGWLDSPRMLLAHGAAALACAVLISVAEHLYVVCASLLCWLWVCLVVRGRPIGDSAHWFVDPVVSRPVLLCSGSGTRAPPSWGVVHA